MKPGFDTLYFSEKGYVLRNQEEGFYQLGFFSFILAMDAEEFTNICRVVAQKNAEEDPEETNELFRNCIIPTPFNGMQLALTRKELKELHYILDKACDEGKALGMINLFNP